MSIKDTLEDYATRTSEDGINPAFASVFYGNDFEANARKTDDAAFPLCQIVQIQSGGFDINPKAGGWKDSYNLFIFFCDKDPKTDLDTTAELNDDIAEHMRLLCKMYIANLNQYAGLELITKVQYKNIFFKFDACVTGVLASFTIRDEHFIKVCPQTLLPE